MSEKRLTDRDFLEFWEKGLPRLIFSAFFSPIERSETSH